MREIQGNVYDITTDITCYCLQDNRKPHPLLSPKTLSSPLSLPLVVGWWATAETGYDYPKHPHSSRAPLSLFPIGWVG